MSEPVRWMLIGFSTSLILMAMSQINLKKNAVFPVKALVSNTLNYAEAYLTKNLDVINKSLKFPPFLAISMSVIVICFSFFHWSQGLVQRTTEASAIRVTSAQLNVDKYESANLDITGLIREQICVFHECQIDVSEIYPNTSDQPEMGIIVSYSCPDKKGNRRQLFITITQTQQSPCPATGSEIVTLFLRIIETSQMVIWRLQFGFFPVGLTNYLLKFFVFH